jgi:cbb3-type cytochrome oxidase maturation protein
MFEYLTLGEFVVAALMAMAALCAFVWGVASGAFRDVEGVKHDVLRVEGEGAWGSSAVGPPCSEGAWGSSAVGPPCSEAGSEADDG